MKRRILSLTLASAMLLGTASGTLAAGEEPVFKFTGKSYIDGRGGGIFDPDAGVTRAELAKMISVMKGFAKSPETFDDVDDKHWAAGFIGAAQKARLIEGDELGRFNPEKGLTRAELATIVSRAIGDADGSAKSFNDIEGHWAKQHILNVSKAGIVEGKGNGVFDPDGKVSRAEAVKMINGMDGILDIHNDIKSKLPSKFTDINGHWAEKHIIVASSSSEYVLEDGKLGILSESSINTSGTHKGDMKVSATGKGSIVYGPSKGTRVIEGNLTVSGDASGEISLRNIEVKGDLIIDTPNATVTAEESAVVVGTTEIKDVSGNTFNNKGKLASVKISDSNGGSFNNLGTISKGITVSPSVKSTGAIVFRGTISVEIEITGENSPQVSFAKDADIKGKIVVNAEGTQLNVDKDAKLEKAIEANKAITIISPKAIKAFIAEGIQIIVKIDSKSEGQSVSASDISGGQISVPGMTGESDKPAPPAGGGGGSSSGGGSTGGNTGGDNNTGSPEVLVKTGTFGISPFGGLKYVEFDLTEEDTFTATKLNGKDTQDFVKDGTKGRVIVSTETDEVKVTVNGKEYTVNYTAPSAPTKSGTFGISPFGGLKFVEFDLADGDTFTAATVNGETTNDFNKDGNKGRVIIGTDTDEVKVEINGVAHKVEYSSVK